MEAQHFTADFNSKLKDHYYHQLTKNRVHSKELRKQRKWEELEEKILFLEEE